MQAGLKTQMFINGVWRQAKDGGTFRVINPSDETVLAEVAKGDAADVDDAVAAAAQALTSWRCSTGTARSDILREVSRRVLAEKLPLARLQSQNNGKPLNEALVDVDDVAATFSYYAELARGLDSTQDGAVKLPLERFAATLRREPCGIVGMIVPWNFPMVTASWKLAPALAAGCTVVLKPADATPLPELALAAIMEQSGLPAGVLNVVTGAGRSVGAAIVAHPQIAKISFTGSNAVGKTVMQTAAETVKGVSLELGGKSAIIVFDDADLDFAATLIVGGIFTNAGQMCSATSRLLVHEAIADELILRLKRRAEAMVVGDPLSDATDMGPLSNQRQYEEVLSFMERAKADGIKLVAGGGRETATKTGYYLRPTIFDDVPSAHTLWRDEIFGPVLCIRRFSSEAEAIREANASDYGLVATVVSKDEQRGYRVASALEVGLVWVNSPQIAFPQLSWGGMKRSSIGRELGPWGLAAFQEIKHVVRGPHAPDPAA